MSKTIGPDKPRRRKAFRDRNFAALAKNEEALARARRALDEAKRRKAMLEQEAVEIAAGRSSPSSARLNMPRLGKRKQRKLRRLARGPVQRIYS